jgi:predicted RNase H-like nuclease
MEYSKIISVTGLSGLYELVTSKADGAVVRSLEDKSSKFVSSRVHNFSHLESIEVYTVKDNTVLAEVFKAIKESKEPIPDAKADGKALKNYFEKVFPDLDFERVYASDMKKIISWYKILTENNIEIKDKAEDEEDTSTGSVIEEIKNETPVPQEGSEKNSK